MSSKNFLFNLIAFAMNVTFNNIFLQLPTSNFEDDEIQIWQKINGKHGNILNLYGAIRRKEKVLIFMEYMEGIDFIFYIYIKLV